MLQLYPFVNLFLFLFSLESLGEVEKDAEEQARLTKEGPELVRRAWEGLEYGLMLLGTRYKEKRLDKWEEMLSNLLLSFNNFCIFAGLSETSAKVLDAGISLQVVNYALNLNVIFNLISLGLLRFRAKTLPQIMSFFLSMSFAKTPIS